MSRGGESSRGAASLRDCFFYAEISRGYVIKTLVDVLAGCFNRATFTLAPEGISLRECDRARSILFDVRLFREKFKRYKCVSELVLSINIKHVQRLIRSLKKKDSLVLRIAKAAGGGAAEMLSIAIRPAAKMANRVETSDVKFQLEEFYAPTDLPDPRFYKYPYVIDSADFTRVKRIASLGKTIKITMQGDNYLSFTCDRDCYASGLEFGALCDDEPDDEQSGGEHAGGESDDEDDEPDDDEPDGDEPDDDEPDDEETKRGAPDSGTARQPVYEAMFHTPLWNHLVKLPGLCSQMQFYEPRDGYPLRVGMEAGRLGDIEVYIKDVESLLTDHDDRA